MKNIAVLAERGAGEVRGPKVSVGKVSSAARNIICSEICGEYPGYIVLFSGFCGLNVSYRGLNFATGNFNSAHIICPSVC